MKARFYAQRQPFGAGVSLHMAAGDDNTSVALPIVMKAIKPGAFAGPFVTIDMHSAQNLMDELWGCGLRPTEGTGSAGSLASTERHLSDMRAIAFAKLEVPKP